MAPRTALAILAGALAWSCAAPPLPDDDRSLGEAVVAAKSRQVLNPTPAKGPVAGLDGVAANESVQRYYDSFKAPPPTFVIINSGAAGAGGGAGR
jgi:hypothetical protein